ncbi:hypothetical protein [Marinospirillum celere]|uniref:hypothetical protein n=1 Tax=Marinospirillum celere TaxID=1122252 RepID=UPI000B8669D7|nr:hypothetical protein [Marinospirillum celere]
MNDPWLLTTKTIPVTSFRTTKITNVLRVTGLQRKQMLRQKTTTKADSIQGANKNNKSSRKTPKLRLNCFEYEMVFPEEPTKITRLPFDDCDAYSGRSRNISLTGNG